VFANELSEHAKMDYEGNKQKRIYCEAELISFCSTLSESLANLKKNILTV
jgi:hypothetical protein